MKSFTELKRAYAKENRILDACSAIDGIVNVVRDYGKDGYRDIKRPVIHLDDLDGAREIILNFVDQEHHTYRIIGHNFGYAYNRLINKIKELLK